VRLLLKQSFSCHNKAPGQLQPWRRRRRRRVNYWPNC